MYKMYKYVPYVNREDKELTSEEILQKYNDKEARLLIPVVIYICILMFAGLIGNALVLYIYKFRFRKSSSRAFILCLAILDTITCLIGIPYHVLDMFFPYKFPNTAVCKCLSYAVSSSLLSSIFVLVLIAIDRYRKICRPFKKQLSSLGTKTTCSIAFLVAAVCVVPNVLLYGDSSVIIPGTNVTGVECYIGDEYEDSWFPMIYNGFLFLVFIACTLLLSILYILVGIKVWRQGTFIDDTGRRTSLFGRSLKLCGSANAAPHTTEEVLSDDEGRAFKTGARSNRRSSSKSDSNNMPKLQRNGNYKTGSSKKENKFQPESPFDVSTAQEQDVTSKDCKLKCQSTKGEDVRKPGTGDNSEGRLYRSKGAEKMEDLIIVTKNKTEHPSDVSNSDDLVGKPMVRRKSETLFRFNVSTGDEPVYKPTTYSVKDPYSTSSHSSPTLQRKRSKSEKPKHRLHRLNTMSESDEEQELNTFSRNRQIINRKLSIFSVSRASVSRKQQRSLRITCMLFLITLVFIISFLPHLVILLLDTLDPDFWSNATDKENVFYNFLFRTYFINNMANPLIYGFLDERFRLEVRLLFRRLRSCKCKAIWAQ